MKAFRTAAAAIVSGSLAWSASSMASDRDNQPGSEASTLNLALKCAAASHAVHGQNEEKSLLFKTLLPSSQMTADCLQKGYPVIARTQDISGACAAFARAGVQKQAAPMTPLLRNFDTAQARSMAADLTDCVDRNAPGRGSFGVTIGKMKFTLGE